MKKNKKLIIIGTGETARLAHQYFTHDSLYEVVAFSVNKQYIKCDVFCGLPVNALEEIEFSYNKNEYEVFVAMGSGHLNRDRQKVYESIKSKNYKCATYISSKAFVWTDVEIGENCFILENNVLQSGVKIENNVVLWSGNHIGHLSTIQDHCFISSHVALSGNSLIGKNCFIGVNSSIADNIKIADYNYIGLGSIINKDTEKNSVYTANMATKSVVTASRLCKTNLND